MTEPPVGMRRRTIALLIAINFAYLFFCCFFQPPWRYEYPFELMGDVIAFVLFVAGYILYLFVFWLLGRRMAFRPKTRLIGHLLPLAVMTAFFFRDLTGIGAYNGEQVIPSPDRSLTLETYINWQAKHPTACKTCVVLRVRDKDGRVLTEIDTHASDVQGWSVDWLDNEQIDFHSSDIGDTKYRRVSEREWAPVDRQSPRSDFNE
ncbi:MAG: hypothetical protein GX444_21280 [Myxococcales bacterium]|nr:hypothetical protein [Myxococcales bacterium]